MSERARFAEVPWKQQSTRQIYQNPWISLREDIVELLRSAYEAFRDVLQKDYLGYELALRGHEADVAAEAHTGEEPDREARDRVGRHPARCQDDPAGDERSAGD